jgi:hypothetical protein
MSEDKLYELRQDVWTPANYYKAGSKGTVKYWQKAFGYFNITWASEWFIDLSIQEEPLKKDELRNLIDSVFKRKRLNSLTYKDAAQEVAELWLKLNQSK